MTWTKTYLLKKTIKVPPGTCEALKAHFKKITETLDLKVEQFKDNPPQWNRYSPPAHISNSVASKTVFGHNQFLRELYQDLAKWAVEPPAHFEELTPEFAKSIWYGFSFLHLSYDRWNENVYTEEMNVLFDIMQGNERWGTTFGEKALTAKQAEAVIALFSQHLDRDDVRLALPNNSDYLVTGEDYCWCPTHGAWRWEDVEEGETDGELICPAQDCNEVVA